MSTLYLTRIQIDYETAFKAMGIPDAYAWHQWAWQAFPGRPDARRDFLTRLDDTGTGFRFLIQSPVPPAKPGTCPTAAWESKPIPDSFFDHPAYHFSLLANPTRKVRSSAGGDRLKNSRRVPVFYAPEKRADPASRLDARHELEMWFSRHAERSGFRSDPAALAIAPRPRQVFTKKSRRDDRRHAGIHAAVEFSGTLEVADRIAFRRAAAEGIGPAKAFGFGMLCLAPACG